TQVEGEEANISDSGFGFARRARQLVGLPEEQLMDNAQALSALLTRGTGPVIFVDDFVGSGNQFLVTWVRRRELSAPRIETSFADVAATGTGQYFYCPLVAAASGVARISAACREVILLPLHTLTDRDSALSPTSQIWPEHLLPSAGDFIREASSRAGIPA